MNLINVKLWGVTIAALSPLSGTLISTVWADTIRCIEEDSCHGTPRNDVITGTVYVEEIFALAGNDAEYAFGGAAPPWYLSFRHRFELRLEKLLDQTFVLLLLAFAEIV